MKVRTTHPRHGRMIPTQRGMGILVVTILIIVMVLAAYLLLHTPIDLGGAG